MSVLPSSFFDYGYQCSDRLYAVLTSVLMTSAGELSRDSESQFNDETRKDDSDSESLLVSQHLVGSLANFSCSYESGKIKLTLHRGFRTQSKQKQVEKIRKRNECRQ